jgi:hypothetical protein
MEVVPDVSQICHQVLYWLMSSLHTSKPLFFGSMTSRMMVASQAALEKIQAGGTPRSGSKESV